MFLQVLHGTQLHQKEQSGSIFRISYCCSTEWNKLTKWASVVFNINCTTLIKFMKKSDSCPEIVADSRKTLCWRWNVNWWNTLLRCHGNLSVSSSTKNPMHLFSQARRYSLKLLWRQLQQLWGSAPSQNFKNSNFPENLKW